MDIDPPRGAEISFARGSLRIWLATVLPGRVPDDLSTVEVAPDELQARSDRFAQALGIGEVELFVWEHGIPNALPLGDRRGGVLVITTALVELLDDAALDAALAHELGHIRHAHGRRFGIWTAVVLGTILASTRAARRRAGGAAPVAALVGTVLGLLVLLALTRRYEREADRGARAHLADPEALARAILAVRTGDGSVDPREVDLRRPSRLERVLAIYPPLDERFPELFADD